MKLCKMLYQSTQEKMHFLPNDFRAYINIQGSVCTFSNMKKKVRKIGIFIQKFKNILSSSTLNGFLRSGLIGYKHVDMKDNGIVITKIPLWYSENVHWKKHFNQVLWISPYTIELKCSYSLPEKTEQRKKVAGKFCDWTKIKDEEFVKI